MLPRHVSSAVGKNQDPNEVVSVRDSKKENQKLRHGAGQTATAGQSGASSAESVFALCAVRARAIESVTYYNVRYDTHTRHKLYLSVLRLLSMTMYWTGLFDVTFSHD